MLFEKGTTHELNIGGNIGPYKFLGEGSFAQCFLDMADGKNVFLVVPDSEFGVDQSKELLVEAYDGNPYLPKISKWGTSNFLNKTCRIFLMPHYRDVTVDDPAWIEMKKLHKVRDDALNETYEKNRKATGKRGSMTFLGNKMSALVVKKAKAKKLNPQLVKALSGLYKEMVKHGPGMAFEFNKNNIGCDDQGHLVLRDPVYDARMVVDIKKAMRKRGVKQDKSK